MGNGRMFVLFVIFEVEVEVAVEDDLDGIPDVLELVMVNWPQYPACTNRELHSGLLDGTCHEPFSPLSHWALRSAVGPFNSFAVLTHAAC